MRRVPVTRPDSLTASSIPDAGYGTKRSRAAHQRTFKHNRNFDHRTKTPRLRRFLSIGGLLASATALAATLFFTTQNKTSVVVPPDTSSVLKTMPLAAADAIRVKTTTVRATVVQTDEDSKVMDALENTRLRALTERARLHADEARQQKRIQERKAALESAPVCQTPQRSGEVSVKAFRSEIAMKIGELKLDTPLALTKDGCKITLRAAFEDVRISRVPYDPESAENTRRLVNHWKACLAENGFKNRRYVSRDDDKGLAYPPSRISENETARGEGRGMGYDCTVSWGRDRVSDASIKSRMRHGKSMPSGDEGGAMGAFQLMAYELDDLNLANPFHRVDASRAARQQSQDIQNQTDGSAIAVMVAYNGGLGAYFRAKAACDKKTITPDCVAHPQTLAYVGQGRKAPKSATGTGPLESLISIFVPKKTNEAALAYQPN